MIVSSTMPDDGQPVAHEAPQGGATGRVMLDGDDLDRLGVSLRCQGGSSGRPWRT